MLQVVKVIDLSKLTFLKFCSHVLLEISLAGLVLDSYVFIGVGFREGSFNMVVVFGENPYLDEPIIQIDNLNDYI